MFLRASSAAGRHRPQVSLLPPSRSRIIAGTLAAFAALSASATASSPVTIAPLKGCYVSVAKGLTEPVGLSATGFHANAAVDVRLDGTPVATVSAGADGRILARVNPPHQRRGARAFVIDVEQRGEPAHRARVASRVTALAVGLRPGTAAPRSTVTWTGRGFTSAAPVFVHYVKDGTVRRTARLTAPRGPCGRFRVRRPQFPFQPSLGAWALQVDQQHSFAPLPDTPFVRLPISVRRVDAGS
jgi:hypothetical protein